MEREETGVEQKKLLIHESLAESKTQPEIIKSNTLKFDSSVILCQIR